MESFYPARMRNAVPLLLGLAGLAYCLWKVFQPANYATPNRWLFGWIGVPLFSLVCFAFLRYLIWYRPSVVISSDGLSLTLPSFAPGLIPWNNVESVAVVRIRYTSMVEVRLKDERGATGEVSVSINIPRANDRQRIYIPESAINVTAEELVERMQKYLENA